MQQSNEIVKPYPRVQSVDIVRGVVMVIMALDHVREFFSFTPYSPTDVTQAPASLFFTRWVTHLCAPSFDFLSGISVYFYLGKVGSLKKTTVFLLTRGLWLIVVEILVISFILTQGYQLTLLEVIWVIGYSMVLLAGLLWLPRWMQTMLAFGMIFGHDALPSVATITAANFPVALLHNTPFMVPEPPVLVAYTVVP